MDDHEKLSNELSAVVRPLLEKAHSLGYLIKDFRLEKVSKSGTDITPRDFLGCTTRCEVDPDGHVRCRVHCP